MNYQRVIVAGNITSDALYRKTKKGGKEYAFFNVATKGYKKERSTYFPVTIFGARAKPLAEFLKKGREVLVEGRIQTDDKRRFSVIADNIELGTQLDPHKDGDADV